MNTDIEIFSKIADPITAIQRMGEWFAKSGLFGCEKLEQGMVLAMACLAERKSPIQLMREYHLIDGRLADRSDSMLAKYLARGGTHKILCRDPEKAAIELTKDNSSVQFSFTWAEAQKEPFPYAKDGRTFKKNWNTPRARMQMLWARVVSDAVRAMDPGIVAGVMTPEEIEDLNGSPAPAASVLPGPASLAPADAAFGSAPPSSLPSSPPSSPQVTAALTPGTNLLTVATCEAILRAIPEDLHAAALSWLQSKAWLAADQSLSHLSLARAQRILNNPAGFVAQISATADQPAA